MKISKIILSGTALSTLLLTACVDYSDNDTDVSSMMSISGVDFSSTFLDDISGFEDKDGTTPTPVNIVISGVDASCMGSIRLHDSAGVYVPTTTGVTYQWGSALAKVVVPPTSNCNGQTATMKVNFTVSGQKYSGSATGTLQS